MYIYIYIYIQHVPKCIVAILLQQLVKVLSTVINPIHLQLNPIYHLLALFGAHHILHISRIGVKNVERTSCTAGYHIELLKCLV